MNTYHHNEDTGRRYCELQGFTYKSHDDFQLYFDGHMPNGSISHGSIIWFGVENYLRDHEFSERIETDDKLGELYYSGLIDVYGNRT